MRGWVDVLGLLVFRPFLARDGQAGSPAGLFGLSKPRVAVRRAHVGAGSRPHHPEQGEASAQVVADGAEADP